MLMIQKEQMLEEVMSQMLPESCGGRTHCGPDTLTCSRASDAR